MRTLLLLVFLLATSPLFSQTFQAKGAEGFIENKGQWPDAVSFMTPVLGGYFFVSNQAFRTVLFQSDHPHGGQNRPLKARHSASTGHCFEAEFIGGNAERILPNGVQSITRYNFFLGNKPTQWGTDARAFPEIEMKELYPGVDVKVFHHGDQLKYDIIAHSAADIKKVAIRYRGLNGLTIKDGKLVMKTSVGNLVEGIPLAYQTIEGKRVRVACRYQLEGTTVRFHFPNGYQSGKPLVVDPVLVFFTYSGSFVDNWGSSAVGDAAGNSYVAGTVYGTNFPYTLGAFDPSFNGSSPPTETYDLGIQKFNPSGNQLLFSTYIGGNEADSPHSLNMDKDQNLLILGTTSSSNFPVSITAYQKQFKGGATIDPTSFNFRYRQGSDLFITRLRANGSELLASTFLGGSGNEGLLTQADAITMNYGDAFRGDVATGPDGSVLIACHTRSTNFPLRLASQAVFGGGIDGVVCRLAPNLDSLIWSTYLGGSEQDVLFSIQPQGNDKVVVCGGSRSQNFPVSSDAYQSQLVAMGTRKNAGCDAIVASFSLETGASLGSTFSGTSAYDQAYLSQTDAAGNVYILGQTEGNMPLTPGCYGEGNGQIFIQKFNPTLTELIWGTRLGLSQGSVLVPSAFLVDSCERIYFSGWGGESNYPYNLGFSGGNTYGFSVTTGAIKTSSDGSDFYFGVLGQNASSLIYGTFYGGNVRGEHVDGGMSRFDKSGTITQAACGCKLGNQYFPGTFGSYQPAIRSNNCNQGVIRMDLGQTKAKYQFNAQISCGQSVTFSNLSTFSSSFVWYWGNGDSLVTSQRTVTHLFPGPGTYVVTLKAISNQTCNRNAIYTDTVRIMDPFSFQSDTTSYFYCKDEVFTPQLQTFPGITSTWLNSRDFIGGTFNSPIIKPTGPFLYIIEYKNASGCKRNRYFQTVPKTPLTLEIKDSFDLNPCIERGVVFLKAKSNGSDYYRWKKGNQVFEGNVFPVEIADSQPFFVSLKGQLTGCTDSIDFKVSPPFFNYRIKPDFETANRFLNCQASEIQFLNTSQNALSFTWNFGDGHISEEKSPAHQFNESGVYLVKLTARNQNCDSTISREVAFSKVEIPNLVTPNGDGKNDFFVINGIEESFSLEVFNRWGTRLFSSAAYQNDWSPKGLTEGVYFFQIRLKSGFSCLNWLDVAR